MPLTFHKYAGVCPVCSKRFYEYGILLAGEPMQVHWSFFHFGSWGASNGYCCTADHLAERLVFEGDDGYRSTFEDKEVFEDEEINTEPAISHKDVGAVDEPGEPEKSVNIETAISLLKAGTRRLYIRL